LSNKSIPRILFLSASLVTESCATGRSNYKTLTYFINLILIVGD